MPERLYPRFLVHYATTVITRDGSFTGMIENISMGGFYLRTADRLEVGEMIQADISLNEGKNVNIMTNATVVRIDDNGIAFKFDLEGHYNYWTLHSYLNQVNA